jgi:hypothetical protein
MAEQNGSQTDKQPEFNAELFKDFRDFQRRTFEDIENSTKVLEDKSRANTVAVSGTIALAALIVKPDGLVFGLQSLDFLQVGSLVFLFSLAVCTLLIFFQNANAQRPTESQLALPEWIFETLPSTVSDRAILYRTQQQVFYKYSNDALTAHAKKKKIVAQQFNILRIAFVVTAVYLSLGLAFLANRPPVSNSTTNPPTGTIQTPTVKPDPAQKPVKPDSPKKPVQSNPAKKP